MLYVTQFTANLCSSSAKPMGKVTRANLAKICIKISLKKRQKGGGNIRGNAHYCLLEKPVYIKKCILGEVCVTNDSE